MRRKPAAGAHDYAQAGRELLERVNLKLDGAPERYADLNPIYKCARTQATLYVGNARLASNREQLRQHGITRIVFCQERDGLMKFQGDPELKYLPYPIGAPARLLLAANRRRGTGQ